MTKMKSQTLAAISSPLPDKSPKGFLDAPIVPVINAINLHPSFFTTSSCSAASPSSLTPNANNNTKVKKKAGGGRWVFITHDPADHNAVADVLFDGGGGPGGGGEEEGGLVFRFEPLIIAVDCADIKSAAISCAFRESGEELPKHAAPRLGRLRPLDEVESM